MFLITRRFRVRAMNALAMAMFFGSFSNVSLLHALQQTWSAEKASPSTPA